MSVFQKIRDVITKSQSDEFWADSDLGSGPDDNVVNAPISDLPASDFGSDFAPTNNLFDLNIEKVLDHWGVEHAIREIIANALDERTLTGTKNIEIAYHNGTCSIRDYGRGLKYVHFTQNENSEKMTATNLIGKFGVGLKDALGVFYRHHIGVTIHSKYSTITLTMAEKVGFDIQTLHAVFSEPVYPSMVGTQVILTGVTQADVEKAKSMFLVFNHDVKFLERNHYGEVYSCGSNGIGYIYANGVQIASEDNFLFCYNITNMNAQMKKALNRERSNVGRTAYSDTIKNILKNCKSPEVMRPLVNDIGNVMLGTNKDETGWVDIASYAAKTLNQSGHVVCQPPSERARLTNDQVEILQQNGRELIMVTDAVFGKIENDVNTFQTISEEYRQSFKYTYVPPQALSSSERETLALVPPILNLVARKYRVDLPNIRISEAIRMDEYGYTTQGVWDSAENAIIISRGILRSKETFAGVLMHEFAHYCSGFSDNTRDFENVLTEMLGFVYVELRPEVN